MDKRRFNEFLNSLSSILNIEWFQMEVASRYNEFSKSRYDEFLKSRYIEFKTRYNEI